MSELHAAETAGLNDQEWADLLSPARRGLLTRGGLVAALAAGGWRSEALAQQHAAQAAVPGPAPSPQRRPDGKSPWGYETDREATSAPLSVRPGEAQLPRQPRPYTDIESYHAHIYFDEDTYQKAALLRNWVAERFHVELGNWNREPRGPHVTPSFYFGFTNEWLALIVPWLQLNSLGLTILIHPNTDDPRADHLYYTLWVNRSQPVNAYAMKTPGPDQDRVEQIYPNTRPTLRIETARS